MKSPAALALGALAALAVFAPSGHAQTPTLHLSAAEAFGVPSASTSPAAYQFAKVIDGRPVRWNPCATIHWRFKASGAPAGGLTIVRQAIAQIALATGTTWRYDGLSTATPSSKWLPTSVRTIRPVLIGWTDGAHSDLLRGRPSSVLAVTRRAYFTMPIGGQTVAAAKAGVIALDRTDRIPLTGAVSWRTTMLHELGHLMGLEHVGSRSQLMYPVLSRSLRDLQWGDRAGLRRLGRTAGCVNIGF